MTPVCAARQYSITSFLLDKYVEKVPALGESITEGTISEWTKSIGESVDVDECVVIIETDKVSVEIKSQHKGVLTRQIGAEDVAVGDDLFELDTDGKVTAAAPAAEAPKAAKSAPAPAPAPTTAAAAAPAKSNDHNRTPLIKFIGKRSLAAAAKHAVPAAALAAASNSLGKPVKEGFGVEFDSLPGGAWFGRPQLSAAEIEAIESGGASAM